MNENPGETPNPLNPAPGPSANPAPNVGPTPSEPAPAVTTPETTPVQPAEGTATNVAPADATGRPIEQATTMEEAPKKKTGLIAGIIIGAVVLIGGSVGLAYALMNMNRDPVGSAFAKIMKNEIPSNVKVNGSINIAANDDGFLFDNVKIDFDSGSSQSDLTNTTTGKVTFSTEKADDVSFMFNEMYTSEGDIYLKIDGLTDFLTNSGLMSFFFTYDEPYSEPIDCIYDEEGNQICDEDIAADIEYVDDDSSLINDVIEAVDGEWLRISNDEIDTLTNGALNRETLTCVTNATNSLKKDNNELITLYGEYPFVESESENLTVQSKKDPIYKLSFDSKNFTSFLNAAQNTTIVKTLGACFDSGEETTTINENSVENTFESLPDLYIEIDGNNNITRLYYVTVDESEMYNTTVDLSFSYPDSIVMSEPTEYINLFEILDDSSSSSSGTEVELEDVVAE